MHAGKLTRKAAELTDQQGDGPSVGDGLDLGHRPHGQVRVVWTHHTHVNSTKSLQRSLSHTHTRTHSVTDWAGRWASRCGS